jgi:starch synthase
MSVNDVWMISRELNGVAGVGGVKDVTRQLLAAIARRGMRATLVMPLYSRIDRRRHRIIDTGIELAIPVDYVLEKRSTRARIYQAEVGGVTVYFVDAQCYAQKEGIYTYTLDEASRANKPELAGSGYFDYFEMNVTLQKAALELIQHLGVYPDAIHGQDAHTAFIPAMMRTIPRYRSYFAKTGVGITIHNAGFGYNQEVFDIGFAQAITEIPWEIISGGMHHGGVYPFIIGGTYAGFINAVSENYAREIMEVPSEDERTGGLGTAFRQRGIQLIGVTNGIDPSEYDPTDPAKMGIAAAYDPAAGDLAGKAECRQALIAEINQRQPPGLRIYGHLDDVPGRPLITMIARLTLQKGIDRFIDAVSQLLGGKSSSPPRSRVLLGDESPSTKGNHIQKRAADGAGRSDPDLLFLVLGTGDRRYEEELRQLALDSRFQGRIAVALGYSPGLANRIYAAGDFFVNPAEFEPCGLTDYMAQLMGSVPVVHFVGGLVKVQNGVTGYGYYPHTAQALAETLRRAIATFRQNPNEHQRIIQQAVQTIHERYTWDKVLEQGYLPLYEQACRVRTLASKR